MSASGRYFFPRKINRIQILQAKLLSHQEKMGWWRSWMACQSSRYGQRQFFYAMIRGIPTFENPDSILFGIAGTISASGMVDVVYLKPAATIDSASIEQALKYAEALLNEMIG
jgi:hypothetical protein